MSSFKFDLGDTVRISVSGTRGEVIARGEYSNAPPSYLLRYKTTNGDGVEVWWAQDALEGPMGDPLDPLDEPAIPLP